MSSLNSSSPHYYISTMHLLLLQSLTRPLGNAPSRALTVIDRRSCCVNNSTKQSKIEQN